MKIRKSEIAKNPIFWGFWDLWYPKIGGFWAKIICGHIFHRGQLSPSQGGVQPRGKVRLKVNKKDSVLQIVLFLSNLEIFGPLSEKPSFYH